MAGRSVSVANLTEPEPDQPRTAMSSHMPGDRMTAKVAGVLCRVQVLAICGSMYVVHVLDGMMAGAHLNVAGEDIIHGSAAIEPTKNTAEGATRRVSPFAGAWWTQARRERARY